MIQNFQEEACFILDTMKGNEVVRQMPFSKDFEGFFIVLLWGERESINCHIWGKESDIIRDCSFLWIGFLPLLE